MSAELLACPFCRQLFPKGEATECPECGIPLKPLAKLPPSYDALAEDPPEPVPVHFMTVPWTFWRRRRGALTVLGLLGLAAFFGPWVHERAPELMTYSGFDLAVRLWWVWAAGIANLVLVPLVVTRRSVHAMRGARVAVAFLAGIVIVTVLSRLLFVPKGSLLRPVRYEWGWGLYANGVLGVLALLAALGFGGKLDKMSDVFVPPNEG